jgi:hypothetical protein
MPLDFVPSGTLCQALNCSMLSQVTQAVAKPQVGWPLARSFFAASNSSG